MASCEAAAGASKPSSSCASCCTASDCSSWPRSAARRSASTTDVAGSPLVARLSSGSSSVTFVPSRWVSCARCASARPHCWIVCRSSCNGAEAAAEASAQAAVEERRRGEALGERSGEPRGVSPASRRASSRPRACCTSAASSCCICSAGSSARITESTCWLSGSGIDEPRSSPSSSPYSTSPPCSSTRARLPAGGGGGGDGSWPCCCCCCRCSCACSAAISSRRSTTLGISRFTTGLLVMLRARFAYRSVLSDSSRLPSAGETHATMRVRVLPPRES